MDFRCMVYLDEWVNWRNPRDRVGPLRLDSTHLAKPRGIESRPLASMVAWVRVHVLVQEG